jgi:pyruvate dehydrogenase E1 component
MTPTLTQDIINCAYWLRKPDPISEVIIAYMGLIASEAIAAAGLIAEYRRGVGILAILHAAQAAVAGRPVPLSPL